MENTLVERLRKAIEHLKTVGEVGNQSDIATRLGYKRAQTISDMLQEKATITTKFVVSFCKEFNIREEWMNDGIGEMRNTKNSDPIAESKSDNVERSFTQIAKEMIFGPNLKPMEDVDKEILNDLKAIKERLNKRLEERKMNNKKNN